MGTSHGLGVTGSSSNKITKAKGKVVKPILKKFSYSEKNSLDLDRTWDDQPQMTEWGSGSDSLGGIGGVGRSARDVNFEISGRGSLSLISEGTATNASRKAFQHGRSPSGNSVATNGSGGVRGGSFVHPFQQLPRTSTSTPPLAYANSMGGFDNGPTPTQRDYSPVIAENEYDPDVLGVSQSALNLTGTSVSGQNSTYFHPSYAATHYQAAAIPAPALGARRPSLASHRTSSLSDVNASTPNLRVNTTGRSTPTLLSTARLAPSKSDLHLDLISHVSPTESTGKSSKPILKAAKTAPSIISPTSSSSTPMSPLRTSLEAMGLPRLRSHSEVDTAARQEQIRKARRKFEEKERAKEEKADIESVRQRDKKLTKDATKIEKERQEWYKATGVSHSGAGSGNGAGVGVGSSVNNSKANLSSSLAGSTILETSASTSGRPSFSRKHTPTNCSNLSTNTSSVAMAGSRTSSGGSKMFYGNKRKSSFPGAGTDGPPRSSSGLYDITTSRKSSGYERGNGNGANAGGAEKRQASSFAASSYTSVPGQQLPMFGVEAPDEGLYPYPRMPSKKKQAKHKTQSAWYGFVMWIRAKMMRMTGR